MYIPSGPLCIPTCSGRGRNISSATLIETVRPACAGNRVTDSHRSACLNEESKDRNSSLVMQIIINQAWERTIGRKLKVQFVYEFFLAAQQKVHVALFLNHYRGVAPGNMYHFDTFVV